MQSLLARLKERNVIRVAGVYAVSGYAVFQIANSLLPALTLPRWIVTVVAVLFLLGFPVAILLAYAYEWTSEGLRRTPAGSTSNKRIRLGWFDWTLLTVCAAVLLIAAAHLLTGAATVARTDTSIGGQIAAQSEAAAPPKSIAVLPFVSFGDIADTEYFADGLTEELINSLAQLPDLKVAGRTSSFYFKNRNEDLREIGRRLGVAHVLEGSVRRSAQNLRVTVQLIEVADGFHLWSETYDRRMSDALAIQTQIARVVAQTLQARLLGDAITATGDARDPRAYQIELVARSRLRKQEMRELEAARALFRELIELEPRNAGAHAGFAEATMSLAQGHLALEFEQARRESEAALDTALELDPRSSEVWRVRGYVFRVLAIRTGEQRHADAALAALRRAAELDPRNADALALLASQLLVRGQYEQATAMLVRSLEIDPLSRLGQQLLGTALDRQGRFGEARRQYDSLIELYPEFTNARVALGQSLMAQGRFDEAVRVLDDEALIGADPLAGLMLANCYANLDMTLQMREVLDRIREPRPAAALARAVLLLRAEQLGALLELADHELAETNDPIWRVVKLLHAVLSDDAEAASAALAQLTAEKGDVERSSAMDTMLVAHALRLNGETAQADRSLEALLGALATATTEYVPADVRWTRGLVLGSLGRTDNAISEMTQAVEQGFRMLIDFDYFLEPDRYPFLRDVAADPRFRLLASRVKSDVQRMRDEMRERN
jgi:TolB-like protein/Tfp pilus assembly protein PilF